MTIDFFFVYSFGVLLDMHYLCIQNVNDERYNNK